MEVGTKIRSVHLSCDFLVSRGDEILKKWPRSLVNFGGHRRQDADQRGAQG